MLSSLVITPWLSFVSLVRSVITIVSSVVTAVAVVMFTIMSLISDVFVTIEDSVDIEVVLELVVGTVCSEDSTAGLNNVVGETFVVVVADSAFASAVTTSTVFTVEFACSNVTNDDATPSTKVVDTDVTDAAVDTVCTVDDANNVTAGGSVTGDVILMFSDDCVGLVTGVVT